MKKIGILGGSFDPVHLTHIQMAKEAKKQFSLSEVLLMPAKYPPHKLEQSLAADEDRFAMLELACEGLEGISPSPFELNLHEVSYTANTLSLLSYSHPEAELYFIVGGDSITYMEKWFRPDIIFSKAHILYVNRKAAGKEKIEKHIQSVLLPLFSEAKISEVIFEETAVSSTRIREEMKKGNFEGVKKDLNPKVFQYMIDHRLYQ